MKCPFCGASESDYHGFYECHTVSQDGVSLEHMRGVPCIRSERDNLRIRIMRFEDRIKRLNEHIKRLEESGDALYENSDPTRFDSLQAANRKLNAQEAWRKTREQRP